MVTEHWLTWLLFIVHVHPVNLLEHQHQVIVLVVVRCIQTKTGAVRVGDAGDVSEDGDAELNADPWNINH